MTKRIVRKLRCAVYTRVSTDERLDQSFNSLDAQREAAEFYVRAMRGEGWEALPERYDDGGFTGATIERPALQRLLALLQGVFARGVGAPRVRLDLLGRAGRHHGLAALAGLVGIEHAAGGRIGALEGLRPSSQRQAQHQDNGYSVHEGRRVKVAAGRHHAQSGARVLT